MSLVKDWRRSVRQQEGGFPFSKWGTGNCSPVIGVSHCPVSWRKSITGCWTGGSGWLLIPFFTFAKLSRRIMGVWPSCVHGIFWNVYVHCGNFEKVYNQAIWYLYEQRMRCPRILHIKSRMWESVCVSEKCVCVMSLPSTLPPCRSTTKPTQWPVLKTLALPLHWYTHTFSSTLTASFTKLLCVPASHPVEEVQVHPFHIVRSYSFWSQPLIRRFQLLKKTCKDIVVTWGEIHV